MSRFTVIENGDSGRPKRWGRRLFLVTAAVVGGGLAVGAGYVANKISKDKAFRLDAPPEGGSFGAWLTIGKDGWVDVAVPNQEMGQGILSTAALLVAEELDCDVKMIRAGHAPVQAVYANPVIMMGGLPFRPEDHGIVATGARWTVTQILRAVGIQATGGSTSTRNIYASLRQAGASARASLVAAAAGKLSVNADKLVVANGRISGPGSGKSVGFGEIAASAAAIPVVGELKPKEKFRLIGTGMPRVDVPSKVDGSARFGIDVREEGQVYAAVVHAPKFGSTLKSAELDGKPAGVLQLVKGLRYYAVVAEGYWQARKALALVKAEWTEGPDSLLSSGEIFGLYGAAIDRGELTEYESRGDLKAAMGAARNKITAEYRVPFLAHATMEPMNCTARVKDGTCTVWVGSQAPTLVKWFAEKVTGFPAQAITVHTPLLGGGFGRRAEMDFVVEGIEIAMAVPGRPVQSIWSREEDMRHDAYRPASLARFEAGLDDKGHVMAWHNRLAGPSVMESLMGRLMPGRSGGAADKSNAEGATFLPYDLPALKVEHAKVPVPVPVGFWRSVGHSGNAFFAESFIDECAVAAKQDPMAYRRSLLAKSPRFLKVLEAVASLSGWNKPLTPVEGKKLGRGVAIAESFNSIVAEVAEVEVAGDGAIAVRKVFAVVDCGMAVDPAIIKAQMASAIIFGLTAALFGRIDIEGGAVKQGNFNEYPLISLANCPVIETAIINSGEEMGGIGEVGTPPIAPAVANAVFQATGKRLRELPLKLT